MKNRTLKKIGLKGSLISYCPDAYLFKLYGKDGFMYPLTDSFFHTATPEQLEQLAALKREPYEPVQYRTYTLDYNGRRYRYNPEKNQFEYFDPTISDTGDWRKSEAMIGLSPDDVLGLANLVHNPYL